MAKAIDLEAQVVYGYLRRHKDTMAADGMPTENHAWCSVKVGGEYRFIDCWLASPCHQYNNKSNNDNNGDTMPLVVEPHWFLCRPLDMIYTHFPTSAVDQYLEPPVSINTFFALPFVCLPFFQHHIHVLDYDPASCELVGDKMCHITLQIDPDIACYAEVETRTTQHDMTRTALLKTRGLAQSLDDNGGDRICKIKAQLPPGQWMGWLKIYAGPRVVPTTGTGQQQQEKLGAKHYPLALCFRLTQQMPQIQQQQQQQQPTFDFVHIHVCQYEFYVQEPQCYQLYPLQKYNFSVKSNQTHHKLAIRSPNGRLYKLMYYPQDHTYDGTITVSEVGQWTLVCLLHHAGGLYVVASWECKV
ncbi:hypothetical protein BDB00DRAFT_885212 [Zychaea mexicana]|uniref:uncharacterized protein n=1 Tax=Zychaea mexicana TaxID=64656 RepID=UPI0022FF31ED|nr:uncharacterized protein BDB00DRAFT_885212 [Zychaea mexicana]KAI9484618.1 hypothetical protein BDB00DRAFT_885212 [Zychaea mexicana]